MNQTLRRILFGAAILALFLCGCTAGPVEIENPATGLEEEVYLAENSAMTEADRAALDEIKAAFESALAAQDASVLMQYVGESFTADEAALTAFFSGLSPHTLYDEYYVQGLKESTIPILIKKSLEDANYLQIIPASKEVYTALYTSGSQSPVDTMLSLMCAKVGGKWSIVWIDISDYLYDGEDAAALYARAKTAYDDGKVMPAFLLAQMTGNIAAPGNALRYPNTDLISEFVYQVMSDGLADYPLPMELEVDGVTLRSVATAKTDLGIVPMFFYSTETPITDASAIEKEAKAVYRAIGERFPGTTEEFKTAELRMTNADPETEENFDYETVLVTLN